MSAIIYSFIIAPSMQCELNKIKQCTSLACTLTFVFDIKLNVNCQAPGMTLKTTIDSVSKTIL